MKKKDLEIEFKKFSSEEYKSKSKSLSIIKNALKETSQEKLAELYKTLGEKSMLLPLYNSSLLLTKNILSLD